MTTWKTLPFPTLLKVDAGKHEVEGTITAPVLDLDQEICDTDQTWPRYEIVAEKMRAASDGQNCLPLREMHQLSAVGKCVHLEKRADKSIYGVFRVIDDAAWEKVEQRVYTGFSQGGRIVRKWQEDGKTYYIADPTECSLVDRPCLEIATFAYVSKSGSVELRKFAKGVLRMNSDHFLTAARHHEELAAVNDRLSEDHKKCSKLHKDHAEHLRKMANDRSFRELSGGDPDKAARAAQLQKINAELYDASGGLR